MEEKRKERNAVKRKNALRILICIIVLVLWFSTGYVFVSINMAYALIAVLVGGVVFGVLSIKFMIQAINDMSVMEETENMEKTKQILSDNTYTPIKCTINADDAQGGCIRIKALKSIVATQEEVIKEFNYTLAAKLSEDKVLYAIVDENCDEISPVDMYDNATFFINNFEKI